MSTAAQGTHPDGLGSPSGLDRCQHWHDVLVDGSFQRRSRDRNIAVAFVAPELLSQAEMMAACARGTVFERASLDMSNKTLYENLACDHALSVESMVQRLLLGIAIKCFASFQ